ncbi:MAG: DUF2723 domain-containing protein [Actinomycetia bacterium]|nr:DUF2723 domain-containing protein [Actinomycetes bacterium]
MAKKKRSTGKRPAPKPRPAQKPAGTAGTAGPAAKTKPKPRPKDRAEGKERGRSTARNAGVAPGTDRSATEWPSWVVPVVTGVVFFIVYALTTATAAVTGDNPEFVVAAHVLGVQHAPGYPWAAMIGWLFSLLPLGNETYAINLAAAAAGAVTVGLIVAIAQRLGARPLLAGLGAAIYGSTALVWEFFTQIEAFPFFSLMVALTTYALLRWQEQPRRLTLLLIAAGLFGIGMSTHQNMSLMVPAILWVVWAHRRRILKRPSFVVLALGVAVAAWLVPYVYVLWAGSRHPIVNWGGVDGIPQLASQLARTNYDDVAFGLGLLGTAPERLWWLVSSFAIALPLIALGAWWARQRKSWYFGFLMVALATISLVMILLSGRIATYGYFVISRFFLQFHVLAAPAIALGLQWIHDWVTTRARTAQTAKGDEPTTSRLSGPALVAPLVGALVVVGSLAWNYGEVNQRGRDVTTAFVDDLLETIPQNGVLLVAGDATALPLLHGLVVDEKRPDVRMIITPLLAADWYVENLRHNYPDLNLAHDLYIPPTAGVVDLVNANPGREFFQIGGLQINNAFDTSIEGSYYFARHGLVSRFVPFAEDVALTDTIAATEDLFTRYSPPSPQDIRPMRTSFEPRILATYADAFLDLGGHYAAADHPEQAREMYERALEIYPGYEQAEAAIAELP